MIEGKVHQIFNCTNVHLVLLCHIIVITCRLAEAEKGVEAGKKLPRQFPSLAESMCGNHTPDVCNSHINFFKSDPFTEKYLCHSFHFHVCEDIQISFFDKQKFLTAETSKVSLQIKFSFFLLFYSLRNISSPKNVG
jgi:hypothetical protein